MLVYWRVSCLDELYSPRNLGQVVSNACFQPGLSRKKRFKVIFLKTTIVPKARPAMIQLPGGDFHMYFF